MQDILVVFSVVGIVGSAIGAFACLFYVLYWVEDVNSAKLKSHYDYTDELRSQISALSTRVYDLENKKKK
jgi:hypothetical protein